MDKALIVVDYTYDFVADDGALTCGKSAQEIEGAIVSLIKDFHTAKQFIVIANDLHLGGDCYHPESNLFPPHNIAGTAGRSLYGRVATVVSSLQDSPLLYCLDKTRYSAFAGTDLELRLRERGIDEIHLTGICSDICVLHTAIEAYNKGFKIVIYKDAIATFNQLGHEWVLNHFQNVLGAKLI